MLKSLFYQALGQQKRKSKRQKKPEAKYMKNIIRYRSESNKFQSNVLD